MIEASLSKLDAVRSWFYILGFFCDGFDGSFNYSAARIRELLENVGLAQESLPSSVVGSAQVLSSVANLLNIRDTELSR